MSATLTTLASIVSVLALVPSLVAGVAVMRHRQTWRIVRLQALTAVMFAVVACIEGYLVFVPHLAWWLHLAFAFTAALAAFTNRMATTNTALIVMLGELVAERRRLLGDG